MKRRISEEQDFSEGRFVYPGKYDDERGYAADYKLREQFLNEQYASYERSERARLVDCWNDFNEYIRKL